MTKRRLTKQERMIRIELARTRATLERQNVAGSLHDLHEALTPSGIWHSFFSRRGRQGSEGQVSWLTQAMTLSRRYPFLLTGLSAALGTIGRGRRGMAWRLMLGSLAGWKLLQRVQRNAPDSSPGSHADAGRITAQPPRRR